MAPGPSLLDVLLGRPSQKYTMPVPKHYYKERPALMRIAAEHSHDTPQALEQDNDEDADTDTDTDVFYTPRSSIVSDMTVTTPPTSDAGHALYTDQDWTKDIQWLEKAIQKPKRTPIPIIPQQRISRPPTPSIMMSMTALLEEDEDGPPIPPKHAPSSSVIISSRSSTPPPSTTHRRARSHGTTTSSLSSYHPPPALFSGPPELPSYAPPSQLIRSSSISQRIRASLRRDTADLSRSRLAQATMASIEVVGGLASPSHNQPPRLGFTHYRAPPTVPKAGVLVQVWAVGLDAVDLRLLGVHTPARHEFTRSRTQSFGRFVGRTIARRTASDVSSVIEKDKEPGHPSPQVGFIPGRSFVGRVLECGWEVRDEIVRRGEWVVGLLDIRKSGALAEFITVDRHRIHRVPHPHTVPSSSDSPISLSPASSAPSSASSEASYSHSRSHSQPHSQSNQDSPYPSSRPSSVSFTLDTPPPSRPASRQQQRRLNRRSAPPPAPPPPPGLDLAELALLPLSGIAAHRAVRTLAVADAVNASNPWARDAVTPEGEFTDPMDNEKLVSVNSGRAGKRRALVLHGHAGTGGLVARMLARRGWRVCVHAPGSLSDPDADESEEADKQHMRRVQERVRAWGVEEVVFDDGGCAADWSALGHGSDGGRGAAVRAVERLIGDGDEFDAVVDTIGGKEVWEAGERLLVRGAKARWKQFTTTVGDCPTRPVPTAKDNFRAGLRALKGGNGSGISAPDEEKKKGSKKEKENKKEKGSAVSYAWVSAAQDVDWEGEDVRDSLGAVVRMTLEEGVRPVVEGSAVPFERAGEVFEGREGSGGVLRGGSVVVRVVG
ncbi:hypothetical protein MVEN_02424500 [Mycena venus]|uniref:Uncharacterized protein n=1 Tax=Mycena venus TaxID=2733690 RepID=A0A8H7CBI5_9AGAR|nr:hypothetical protein MVEN_02424500 [Mycena venus]